VNEIIKKLEQQDKKLDAIYASAEKTRKYLLWTLIDSQNFPQAMDGDATRSERTLATIRLTGH
jgi:hypothetical protein